MKRITAILLTIALITGIIGTLSGCGKKEDVISTGQWLSMINESFGMESYSADLPYIESISPDNQYFEAVQIACEWDVINKDAEIDVAEPVRVKAALINLVNAGNFIDLTKTDEEKLTYAQENFTTGKTGYAVERYLNYQDAQLLIAEVQYLWANKTYDHVIEEATYADGVVDLTQEDFQDIEYRVEENVTMISLDSENASEIPIQSGDTYVLPANGENFQVTAHKAQNVYVDDGILYIENDDEELELTDVAENIFIEETFTPMAERAVFYDGNGNVISMGSEATLSVGLSQEKELGLLQSTNLLAVSNQTENYWSAMAKSVNRKHEFKIDGCTVALEYPLTGPMSLKASVKVPLYESPMKKFKLEGSTSFAISDFKVTNKLDFGFLKINSALLKVDYQTKAKFEIGYTAKLLEKVAAPKYSNGNGNFLANLKRTVLKDKDAPGAKTIKIKKIKIASVDLYSAGLARVCLDVSLNITSEGSVSVTVTENGSKGLEYRNKNLRVINVSNKNTEAQLKANLTGTIGIGPAFYTIGLKKQVIGAAVQIGVGVEGTATLHLADPENHLLEESGFTEAAPEMAEALSVCDLLADPSAIIALAESQGGVYTPATSGDISLHLDNCVDLSAYFILKIGLEDNSYAADLLGGKIKTSWEAFGKDNATFLNVHIDNLEATNIEWGGKAECSFKYVPFDRPTNEESEQETEEDNANSKNADSLVEGDIDGNSWTFGDYIVISEMKVHLNPGDKRTIIIEEIPEGYKLADIQCESEKPTVAAVDKNGVVTGVTEGSTIITFFTSDGKYKVYCGVTVLSTEEESFTPLGYRWKNRGREVYL